MNSLKNSEDCALSTYLLNIKNKQSIDKDQSKTVISRNLVANFVLKNNLLFINTEVYRLDNVVS